MATNNVLNAPFPLSSAQGGLGVASPTAHGILIAEGSSAAVTKVLAAGEILVGTTAGDPANVSLIESAGINITSASGSITIATDLESADGVSISAGAGNTLVLGAALTAGEGISIDSDGEGSLVITATSQIVTWVPVSGITQALATDNGYIANNAALCTFTIPSDAALGDEYTIVAPTGSGGFKIVPAVGTTQRIRLGNQITTVTTGYIQSSALGDVIDLVCVNATADAQQFMVLSAVGTLIVV